MRLGSSFRFNGLHKACGARFSTFAVYSWDNSRTAPGKAPDFYKTESGAEFELAPDGSTRLVYLCACGVKCYARSVIGKFNPSKKCNAKCQASAGHQCECSCGGKNHGAGHG